MPMRRLHVLRSLMLLAALGLLFAWWTLSASRGEIVYACGYRLGPSLLAAETGVVLEPEMREMSADIEKYYEVRVCRCDKESFVLFCRRRELGILNRSRMPSLILLRESPDGKREVYPWSSNKHIE